MINIKAGNNYFYIPNINHSYIGNTGNIITSIELFYNNESVEIIPESGITVDNERHLIVEYDNTDLPVGNGTFKITTIDEKILNGVWIKIDETIEDEIFSPIEFNFPEQSIEPILLDELPSIDPIDPTINNDDNNIK